jgi:predicted Zn-dependent peptidase
MESDRLLNRVFREFYAERDVVREERRMRVESTPTGRFEEEFEALFWTSSPYSWPTVGWPSDLQGITRAEAESYYDLYYAPNNLVACLVGEFDPEQAKQLAERYFSRLKRNPNPVPVVRTREVEQQAERRMLAHAETNPQVEIRYHTVPEGHRDEPALTVLGSLLSGRTGRLHKSLVLDQKIASSAAGGQNALKYEGYFAFSGVARPGHTPEDVESALYKEIDKLQTAKVEERELQKVKNRFAADTFRRVQSNFALMLQLLLAENTRGWETFNTDPKRLDAVTADDVQRVAKRYFLPDERVVAIYYTKKAAADETDALLEGLTEEEAAAVRQMRPMIQSLPVEKAREMLAQMEQQAGSAPPDKRRVMEAIVKLLQQRIEKGGAL